MNTLNDFAHPGMKVHARTPGVILLAGDLKKLVHLLRMAVERQQAQHPPSERHKCEDSSDRNIES